MHLFPSIVSRHFIFLCIQFFLNNSIQKEFKNKVEKSELLISDQLTTDHDEAACLHSGGLFLPSPLTGPLPPALPPAGLFPPLPPFPPFGGGMSSSSSSSSSLSSSFSSSSKIVNFI